MQSSPQLEILSRVVRPRSGGFTLSEAKAILKLGFKDSDRDRMRELLERNHEGNLTPTEQGEIEGYQFVSHFLTLIHSKARQSIKRAAAAKG